jgi:NAD(P)-dependent dehydrogenase (short-subunit alcohol dehydrogenase family)
MSAAGTPEVVGVIGGGRMGAGIAHAFVLAGSRIVVLERDREAADAASARIERILGASVDRGATAVPLRDLRASVSTASDTALLADADLVIEAVPEDRALKIDALRRAASVIRSGATLATNTSSISIDDLAESLDRPEDFLGLHFFNPVPLMKVIEVVGGIVLEGVAERVEICNVMVQDAIGFTGGSISDEATALLLYVHRSTFSNAKADTVVAEFGDNTTGVMRDCFINGRNTTIQSNVTHGTGMSFYEVYGVEEAAKNGLLMPAVDAD